MNLYKYHCEPKEARRELYHRGWSLIPRSYTIFSVIFPSLLHRTEEDYGPFSIFHFPVATSSPVFLDREEQRGD